LGGLAASWLAEEQVEDSTSGFIYDWACYPTYGYDGAGTVNSQHQTYWYAEAPSQFTGKERDAESDLDYFAARYYSSNFGRFLSPDEFTGGPVDAFSPNDPLQDDALPYAVISNPQSLNKYTYTWNYQLPYTDPDGHFLDTFIDAVSVGYGIASVVASAITGSDQLGTDAKALAADVAALVIPGVTGLGNAVRAGKAAENIADAAKAADKAADAGKAADKAGDAGDAAQSATKAKGSGPKADDAPGVTAGGQATDKYGNKLGPSGKPMVNKTTSNTREAARNKALNEGSGAVEHRKPKKGKPHFHSTTKKGEKQSNSTHHEYPD
jgi:RHS repeat-associated protein